MDKEPNKPNRRRWRTAVFVVLGIILYAYAIQVTDVNLEEPLEPRRQQNLVGLIRQLARPNFLAFETDTVSYDISLRMPCPEQVRGSQVTADGRLILLAPNCVNTTQDSMTLSGEGFPPNSEGAIIWHPPDSNTDRRLGNYKADSQGNFSETFTMPDVRETAEAQRIEIVEVTDRRITGLSATSEETLERILETILMAFMASTIGTILAVPISFLAARNLMIDVKMPLAALMAGLILAPIGGWLGFTLTGWINQGAALLSGQTLMGVGAFAGATAVTWPLLWLGTPVIGVDRRAPNTTSRLRLFGVLLLFIFNLGVLAQLGLTFGSWLEPRLGIFGFLGNFVFVISDFTRVFLPLIVGFIGTLVALSFGSNLGQSALFNMQESRARVVTFGLALVGTAVLFLGIFYSLNWICFFGICNRTAAGGTGLWLQLGIPALIIGLVAAFISLRAKPKRPFAIGTVIFTLTRGILNGLRSIEPVLMGFVFVVWVGIGPLAGTMVLALHSIADLGKLFSEQVENIAQGPLEAVTATGANRVQTIVYAVIPQIVPHFTAFAFYRWDINVRMSTIIGFVGGGGIGLVLQRATNLTQYRNAAVMVIAIALVVVVLDYISSKIRSRII